MQNGPPAVGEAGTVLSPMGNRERAYPRNPEKTRRIRVDTADPIRYGMKPRTVHDYLADLMTADLTWRALGSGERGHH